MTEAMTQGRIEGACLCGAVSVRARMTTPAMRACHCEMCRKLTSSMFMSLNADQDSIEIAGDVTLFRSSEWAQRGFCGICGSTIFYSTVGDGARHLAAGLFKDAGGAPMKIEFYEDNCPGAYALKGEHKKLSAVETVALFTGEAP